MILSDSQKLLHFATTADSKAEASSYRAIAAFKEQGKYYLKGFNEASEVRNYFDARQIDRSDYVVIHKPSANAIHMT